MTNSSTEEFNSKAVASNIGSKYPIQSSQYKHDREYTYRYDSYDGRFKPTVSPGVMRGARYAIVMGLAIWAIIIYGVVHYGF
jgi:hypothetical protein